jgi:hypothetical protein
MNLHNTPIDFIAYDADEQIVLLAEAKSRLGTSGYWASKLRRNMLAHGLLPKSRFFLIATPERMYGWKQESLLASDDPPQFTVDAREALQPYFAKLKQNPDNISPRAFEYAIDFWDSSSSSDREGSI